MQFDMDDVRHEPDPRTTPVRNRVRRDGRGSRTNIRHRAIVQSRRGW